jgi:hypothetical protein
VPAREAKYLADLMVCVFGIYNRTQTYNSTHTPYAYTSTVAHIHAAAFVFVSVSKERCTYNNIL